MAQRTEPVPEEEEREKEETREEDKDREEENHEETERREEVAEERQEEVEEELDEEMVERQEKRQENVQEEEQEEEVQKEVQEEEQEEEPASSFSAPPTPSSPASSTPLCAPSCSAPPALSCAASAAPICALLSPPSSVPSLPDAASARERAPEEAEEAVAEPAKQWSDGDAGEQGGGGEERPANHGRDDQTVAAGPEKIGIGVKLGHPLPPDGECCWVKRVEAGYGYNVIEGARVGRIAEGHFVLNVGGQDCKGLRREAVELLLLGAPDTTVAVQIQLPSSRRGPGAVELLLVKRGLADHVDEPRTQAKAGRRVSLKESGKRGKGGARFPPPQLAVMAGPGPEAIETPPTVRMTEREEVEWPAPGKGGAGHKRPLEAVGSTATTAGGVAPRKTARVEAEELGAESEPEEEEDEEEELGLAFLQRARKAMKKTTTRV